MSFTSLQGALAAVQKYLAKPLGALAKPIPIMGLEDSVGFDHGGRFVSVWFHHYIVAGRQPEWVRVCVGPMHRLYRTESGFILAEAGTQGFNCSTLYVETEDEIVEILQAALQQIRQMAWTTPAKMAEIRSPEDALRLVKEELTGPLKVKASFDRGDRAVLQFKYGNHRVGVQFPSAMSFGWPVDWVRVALDQWSKYLYSTPEGYMFGGGNSIPFPSNFSHDVRTLGDLVEVMRAARLALAEGRILPDKPVPEIPREVVQIVEKHFVSHLGIQATTWAKVLRGEEIGIGVSDGTWDLYIIYFDSAFLSGTDQGRWLEVSVGQSDQPRYVGLSESGFYVTEKGATAPPLQVDGLQGAEELLPRCAAFLTEWMRITGESPHPTFADRRKPAIRLVSQPRLWNVTEADSSFYSLPSVIKRMRKDLSAEQDHPLTWDEMVERAKRTGAFPRAEDVDPGSDDLMEAAWVLASLWFKTRHPGVSQERALNFGMVVVETACQDIASLGDFSEEILKAHDVVHGEIGRQQMTAASRSDTARAVIDALERYFLSGGAAGRKTKTEGPIRRVLRSITEEIRKRGWPHGGGK